MQKCFNKANIYILAWCVYSTQGILFPKGTLFTQLLVIVLLLVSLYYIFVANTRYKLPVYFIGLNILLAMFTIYGVYLMIGGYDPAEYAIPVDSFGYLKNILISLTPIYPFYVFSREGLIDEKFLSMWLVVLIGLTIANYYEKQKELLYAVLLRKSNREEFTNNVAYDFLALVPLCVFLYKKPIIQYIALGVCMLFIFMAMKRGAVFIGVISLILFIWNNLKKISLTKKIGMLILSTILLFSGYLFVESLMQKSLFFQKRVESTMEGNSSGRDVLYGRFADYFWNETSSLQYVLGSGANATLKIYKNYAHNDWLEIAVNQGLLGICVFCLYWFFFLKNVFSRCIGFREKFALQLILIALFLMTIFSMSYTCVGYVTGLVLGYSLSQERKHEQIIYSN